VTEEVPILEVRGAVKRFGAVTALADGNFSLRKGEVHAIVGDNGAGKSTMLKIIAGAHRPDGGQLLVEGQPVSLGSPRDASDLGIATVFQDLALIDHLDASANLFLGREVYKKAPLGWLGFLDRRIMRSRAIEEVHRLKVGVKSVDQLVMSMSGGQRQAVAVARAVAFGTKVVVMDEPTAALGVRETKAVLDMIRELNSQGLSVVIISHSLPDVFSIANRVTVLRLGATVTTANIADTSREDLVGMMTGAYNPNVKSA
jgi:ABC-type sugar transport system ATPase subunit